MVRRSAILLHVSIVAWAVLATAEVVTWVEGTGPLMPTRFLAIVLAALITTTTSGALVALNAPRVVLAQVAEASASARSSEEPTTGDLAFGLGREFERARTGAGSRLRSVGE